MRKLFLPAVACTLWLVFTGSAAAQIVYPVNLSADGGSVVGSITTDGTLGPLSTFDIVSFDLTLTDLSGSAQLAAGLDNDTVFIGGGLSATPTALTFDFGNSGAFVNFFSAGSAGMPGCTPIWTLRAEGGATCNGITGTVDAIALSADLTLAAIMMQQPGDQLTVAELPVSAPEPASLGMLIVGLVSMIGLRKLRF